MISSLKFSSVLKVKDTIIIGFHDKRQTRAKEAAQTAFFLQTVVISDSFQHDIYANVGDNEFIRSRAIISKRTLWKQVSIFVVESQRNEAKNVNTLLLVYETLKALSQPRIRGSSFIDNCNWNPIPKNVMRFFLQMISEKNILGRNINFYDSTLTT